MIAIRQNTAAIQAVAHELLLLPEIYFVVISALPSAQYVYLQFIDVAAPLCFVLTTTAAGKARSPDGTVNFRADSPLNKNQHEAT